MAKRKSKSRLPIGELFHRLILFIRRLIDAFRHVKTGGQSTERRARARAAAPPRRCPECQQHVHHSGQWEDHLDECLDGTGGGRPQRDEDDLGTTEVVDDEDERDLHAVEIPGADQQ